MNRLVWGLRMFRGSFYVEQVQRDKYFWADVLGWLTINSQLCGRQDTNFNATQPNELDRTNSNWNSWLKIANAVEHLL